MSANTTPTPPRKFVPVPFAYHQEIELTIENLSNQGDGVGRIDNWVVFVPYTLPGEKVRARVDECQAAIDEEMKRVKAVGGMIVAPVMGVAMANAWLEAEHLAGLDPETAAQVGKEADQLALVEEEQY